MRDGPHGLDRGWTKISAFLQDERTAQEKSDEKKTTSHSAEFKAKVPLAASALECVVHLFLAVPVFSRLYPGLTLSFSLAFRGQ